MLIRTLLIYVLSWCTMMTANAEKAVVLEQEDAPLSISSYTNRIQEEFRHSNPIYARPEAIIHNATVENVGNQRIVAYELGFISLDVFYDNAAPRLNGVALRTVDIGGSFAGEWQQRASTYRFADYGIGIAYVNRARLYDGTIWEADLEEILFQLTAIYSELDAGIFEDD